MHCIFYIFDPNTTEYEKEDVKYTAVILFLTVIHVDQKVKGHIRSRSLYFEFISKWVNKTQESVG